MWQMYKWYGHELSFQQITAEQLPDRKGFIRTFRRENYAHRASIDEI